MGNDTVLAITRTQLVTINRSLNDYLYLREINRTLKKDLLVADSLCYYLRLSSAKKDTLYSIRSKQLSETTSINKTLELALKKEKRKKKLLTIGVGVGGTLLGVFLGVLLK